MIPRKRKGGRRSPLLRSSRGVRKLLVSPSTVGSGKDVVVGGASSGEPSRRGREEEQGPDGSGVPEGCYRGEVFLMGL